MGGSPFGQRAIDLSRSARSVKQDRWMVYEVLSTTQFAVVLSDPIGAAPWVTTTLAADYVDCEIEFITGPLSGIEPAAAATGRSVTSTTTSGVAIVQFGSPSLAGRVSSMIKSLVSELVGGIPTTIITLYEALPANPNPNDQFIIYRRQSPSSSSISSDLRENAYLVQNIDLTVLRTPYQLLGVSGRSCTILALGGAPWQIGFVQGNAILGSLISSSLLFVGSMFQLDFNDLAIANAAAVAGTSEAILYVGQKV